MKPIPPLDLCAELKEIGPDFARRTQRVLTSGKYVVGEQGAELEARFRDYTGSPHAVGVASGSDALLLALAALGVKAGDEVITTPFTFFATVSAIIRTGAVPVLADIDPVSFNLDPKDVLRKLSKKTKGIIAVHLYGNPCQLDVLTRMAREHRLFLIEDCAQACGATYRGKKIGSFGDFGAFSFYPSKNLAAAGDAGIVTMKSVRHHAIVRSLHIHGEKDRKHTYLHVRMGMNSRLDEIQAAVLNAKLAHLDDWNARRRTAARRYVELFFEANLPARADIQLPVTTPHATHVYHQFTIRAPKRNALLSHLRAGGIFAGIYYPVPMHRQPSILPHLRYRTLCFKETDRAVREVISLPIFPQITPNQQARIVKAISRFYK